MGLHFHMNLQGHRETIQQYSMVAILMIFYIAALAAFCWPLIERLISHLATSYGTTLPSLNVAPIP